MKGGRAPVPPGARRVSAEADAGATAFVRVLGRRDVLALALGAMIGWSWVVLAGTWITEAGTLGAAGAFLVGGAIMVLVGLVYAELAAALPFAGGEHVYSERALGRGASFVCTWAIVLGYASVVAFEAVAFPTVVASLLPGFERVRLWSVAGFDVHLTWVLTGVLGGVVVTVLNVVGVRVAAVVQTAVVGVVLVAGLLLAAGALTVPGPETTAEPFAVGGAGFLAVLVMVPFLFVGFDVIPQAAEEIDLPHRAIGVVLLVSVALAAGFYAMVVLAVGALLPPALLAEDGTVTAEAAARSWGPAGRLFLLLAGLAGILTSWNAFLLGGSRAVFALARSGLLPARLARIHPRFRTPVNAILLIGGTALFAPLFGRPVMVWLVDAGGFGIVLAYLLVVGSFLVLRIREPELARPFRLRAGVPLAVAAGCCCLWLLTLYLPGSPSALVWPAEWVIVLAWAALGAVLYASAGRRGPGAGAGT
jgi:APA family basic amino acid/polyamine antiporter